MPSVLSGVSTLTMEKNSRDYPERQATEKITGKYAFKVYDK